MGLSENADVFVSRLLIVTPIYGWGWMQGVAGADKAKAIDVPEPFQLRLQRLWEQAGERRGGVGQVEESGHPWHGQWVIFSTRHVGTFDFTEQIGLYNVSIAPVEPTGSRDGWPESPGEGWIGMNGYAEIRAQVDE